MIYSSYRTLLLLQPLGGYLRIKKGRMSRGRCNNAVDQLTQFVVHYWDSRNLANEPTMKIMRLDWMTGVIYI
jgi:hypothetical protein